MKIDNQDLYEKIGNLLYAIAMDQHMKPLEISELKFYISMHWHLMTEQPVASKIPDSVHTMLMTIDTLEGELASASNAYEAFKDYYLQHPELFSTELKQQIQGISSEIARFFAAHQTGENHHLIELKTLLFPHLISKL